MRRTSFLLCTTMLVLWLGCGTSRESATPGEASAKPDATASVEVIPAYVFVDGKARGTTPNTIHVRRGFGESVISLKVGNTVVRTFQVERAPTSNRSELDLTYQGRSSGTQSSFDITDLNTAQDGSYLIPYFSDSIQIEDRAYGLTLVVEH